MVLRPLHETLPVDPGCLDRPAFDLCLWEQALAGTDLDTVTSESQTSAPNISHAPISNPMCPPDRLDLSLWESALV